MTERTEKLSVEVEVRGHDAAAKDVDALTRGTTDLTEEIKGEEKALTKVTERTKDYGGQLAKLRDNVTGTLGQMRELVGRGIQASDAFIGLSNWAGHVAVGMASAVAAIKATSFAVRRLLPGISALTHAGIAIVGVIRDEVKERLRLIEVMKIQSQATDELQNKQLGQKQRLERTAGRRGVGGFQTADAARLAQVQAARAKEQFSQLEDADTDAAVGLFGDVPGLTQEDLTDLAIVASFGGLQDVDASKIRSRDTLRRIAERKIDRYRPRIETFAARETVQGAGLGRGQYRTGQPPEAAQRALDEMEGEGGEAALRQRLSELLPPGVDLDRAVRMAKLFGGAEEFAAARISQASLRGITAGENIMKARPMVEVGLPDQPGYVSQALGAFGGTLTYEEMGVDEFEHLQRAYGRIEREGRPGAGFATSGRGPGGEAGGTTIHNDNRTFIYNPRNYKTQSGLETNGNKLLGDME